MTRNRFSELKFSGPAWKQLLKRMWFSLFRRPRGWRLGVDTFVYPPYACNEPGRLDIGSRSTIGSGVRFQLLAAWFEQRFDPHISIGNDCYLGTSCELVAVSGIHIGAGCTLSDNVYINDSSHGFDPRDGLLMDRALTTKGPILIGDGCFIGRGATVLPGVQLGEHCVVGACAVVTRSAPAGSMLTGNPARIVAQFDQTSGAWVRLL